MALAAQRLSPNVADDGIPPQLVKVNGGRPAWLLVPYANNTWVVTDTGEKSNCTIRFNVGLPGGKKLADHPHLLGSIKRVVYGVRTGPLMTLESGATQSNVASNLIVLARWMLNNGIERFQDLTSADIHEYAKVAAFGVHAILNSEGMLHHYLEAQTVLAGFDVHDTVDERRAKAIGAFPVKTIPRSGAPVLARDRLMLAAGLDGIGFGDSKGVVVSILDEVELLCEFAQSRTARGRMLKSPSLDELDDVVVTEEQLRRLLMSFEHLHRHRRYLVDALQVKPFPFGNARTVARTLGKDVGRTATVPVQQAATLIERSIRWVLDYAPVILDIKDWADLRFDESPSTVNAQVAAEIGTRAWPSGGASSPFPILVGQRTAANLETSDEILQAVARRQGMPLPAAIAFLVTACVSVIAAFSARRAAEVVGLKEGCIERDESGQPWIRVFIHKTVQADSVVPVPEVVVAAVSVLERLSRRARTHSGTSYLPQYNLPGSDVCIGLSSDGRPNFRLGAHLRSFGYFVDVPELADGSRWTFRPHQFRRFFAILYIWVYDLGDWGALSYHLRHFNPEMTRRYVSDDELGHIIAVANREHTAAILASAALGKTAMSGSEGTRLKEAAKRLYDRMSQRVQAVSERKFSQRVLSFVERTGVTLHALPWGYCGASDMNAAGGCACASDIGNSPDYGNATALTCGNCVFNIRTGSAVPYLTNSLSFHQKIAATPGTPEILRRASSALSIELSGYLATVGPSRNPTGDVA